VSHKHPESVSHSSVYRYGTYQHTLDVQPMGNFLFTLWPFCYLSHSWTNGSRTDANWRTNAHATM